uniref:Uncharacterized protein LOC110214513 n=1 Tax=Phascolarctos cinereus TaxID=38626 RepID=A0A6P5L2Y9_PHACI|nr:uncharacterized protein LOC110214513 [Phascolarctos cinereus]
MGKNQSRTPTSRPQFLPPTLGLPVSEAVSPPPFPPLKRFLACCDNSTVAVVSNTLPALSVLRLSSPGALRLSTNPLVGVSQEWLKVLPPSDIAPLKLERFFSERDEIYNGGISGTVTTHELKEFKGVEVFLLKTIWSRARFEVVHSSHQTLVIKYLLLLPGSVPDVPVYWGVPAAHIVYLIPDNDYLPFGIPYQRMREVEKIKRRKIKNIKYQ